MVKFEEAKISYTINAQKNEKKHVDIRVEFNLKENRIIFYEKDKLLFWVSACDADSLAKKYKKVHEATMGDMIQPINPYLGSGISSLLSNQTLGIATASRLQKMQMP